MNPSGLKNRFLQMVAVGLLVVVAAPARAADEPDAKVEAKAKALVEKNRTTIALFAHPTGKFLEMKYLRTEKVKDGGFKVTYEFDYVAFKGYGARYYSNLAFSFDNEGFYRTVETAGRNCTVAPFTAADAAIAVVQAVIKNEPELREKYEVLRLIEKADARDLLKFMLAFSR